MTSSHESVSGMEEAPKPKPKGEPSEDSRDPPPNKDKEAKDKKKKKELKERDTKDPPRPPKDEGNEKTVVPPANFNKQPPPPPSLVTPPKLATPHLPPIRYATAAAAAMGHTSADDSFDASSPVQMKSPVLERVAPEASPAVSHASALPPPPGLSAQVDNLTDSLAKASVENATRNLPPALEGVADTLEQTKQNCMYLSHLLLSNANTRQLCCALLQPRAMSRVRWRTAPRRPQTRWIARSPSIMFQKCPTRRLRTTPKSLCPYLILLGCTPSWMWIRCSSFSTISKGHITNTWPPVSSKGKAGASTNSTLHGFSGIRSQRRSPMSTR